MLLAAVPAMPKATVQQLECCGWLVIALAACFAAARYMDVRNQVGHTAVHYAVQAGAQGGLAMLLSAGANPSFASLCDCMVWDNLPKGSSPLHVAARRNEPALALQLLKAYVSKQLCLAIVNDNGISR
jgi:hypothetical protein